MWPSLSTGAINRILNGEDVQAPILQILGYKKIPQAGTDHYRFLISDGVTDFPFALLGSQLNNMVTNKELENFTIVKVDKCVCNEVQPDRKAIILLNLTALIPGNEVNEQLGNPMLPPTARNEPTVHGKAQQDINYGPTEMNDFDLSDDFQKMWPSLSTGAINRILNDEDVPTPTFQILDYKKIPGSLSDRYRLLISDGITGCSFVILDTQLNHMVTNKELEKFTIVKISKYICNKVQVDRKFIILLNLTVLVPGNEVNEKLGNPIIPSTGNEAAVGNEPPVNGSAQQNNYGLPKMNGSSLSLNSQKMWPSFSTGAINRILNGEHVQAPILQILGYKKIPQAGIDYYRFLISDGVTDFSFSLLDSQLNNMVTNKELENFTIVKVDKYVCNEVQPNRKAILLIDLTVLVPGNEVNEKLENLIISSTCGNKTAQQEASSAPAVHPINNMFLTYLIYELNLRNMLKH